MSLFFPLLLLPKYELNVILNKVFPIYFHFPPLWILATKEELSRAKLISNYRPFVRTGSSPTCGLIHEQTEIFSALFCV